MVPVDLRGRRHIACEVSGSGETMRIETDLLRILYSFVGGKDSHGTAVQLHTRSILEARWLVVVGGRAHG